MEYTLFYGVDSEEAFIEIGESDISAYSNDPSQTIQMTMAADSQFWELYAVQGAKLDADFYSEFERKNRVFGFRREMRVVFDSTNQNLYLPRSLGPAILQFIFKDLPGFQNDFGFQETVSCDRSLFPSLFVAIQEKWVEIPPEYYVKEFSRTTYNGKTESGCYLMLKTWEHDMWMLGVPFFNGYYSLFDPSAATLTISPRLGSPISAFPEVTETQNKFNWWFPTGYQKMMFVGTVVGLMVGIPLLVSELDSQLLRLWRNKAKDVLDKIREKRNRDKERVTQRERRK